MNSNRRSLLLGPLLALALASGCFISREYVNADLDPASISELVPGITTAREVVEKLGAPAEVVQLGRRSAYRYEHTQQKRAGFSVIVITFINADLQSDRTWVFFDENDLLTPRRHDSDRGRRRVRHALGRSRLKTLSRRLRSWAPALLIWLGASACASVSYERTIVREEVPRQVLTDLPPSGWTLEACLEHLGAPTLVQEHRVHGLVLAWSWVHQRDLGASVSVPVSDNQSVSFSYNDIRSREKGVVLWFDEDWVLESWRHGFLRELLGEAPPPASIEDIEREGDSGD